jgi:hypothetical protein
MVLPGAGLNLPAVSQMLPMVECDTCNLFDQCPERREGSVCAYNELFTGFDTRDPDQLVATMEWLTTVDWQRASMAVIQERLTTGGQIDPRTTAAMDSYERRAARLIDIKQARDPRTATTRVTVVEQRGGPTPSAQGGGQGPGVLAMFFGGQQGALPQAGAGEEEEPAPKGVLDTTARERKENGDMEGGHPRERLF